MRYSLDRVWFDLDGTLIDSSERMYKLFQDIVPESRFTKEEYWELKRNKINHKEILRRYFPQYKFEDFNSKWMRLIEAESYLMLDKLYSDAKKVLESIHPYYKIVLITARQSENNLKKELEALGIIHLFDHILVTEGKTDKKILAESFCKMDGLIDREHDYFVSDMGKDIICGKEMGCSTIAITHGFMSAKNLAEYYPMYVINNLMELNGLLTVKS